MQALSACQFFFRHTLTCWPLARQNGRLASAPAMPPAYSAAACLHFGKCPLPHLFRQLARSGVSVPQALSTLKPFRVASAAPVPRPATAPCLGGLTFVHNNFHCLAATFRLLCVLRANWLEPRSMSHASPLLFASVKRPCRTGPGASHFRAAIINPTAIRNKEQEICSLACQLVCVAETSAVAKVQAQFSASVFL